MAEQQTLHVEIELGREVKRVADALRQVDRSLPTWLRRELRRAGAAGVKRARAEARALPSGGRPGGTTRHPHKPKQLRRRLAAGVRVRASARTGMRIVTSMPTTAEAMLPRGMDAGSAGWRHKVFGRDRVWVRQEGDSWFLEPLAEEYPALIDNVRGVLEEAARTVQQAGA